jgi:hypothetical protein
MRRHKSRRHAAPKAVLVAAFATLLLTAGTVLPAPRSAAFRRSDYQGSGTAQMRTEAAPARVGRVTVVPRSPTEEAWAIGYSSALIAGYDRSSVAGQIVFLTGRRGDPWHIAGPPLRSDRTTPFNPTLFAFDIAATGEGWAVGENGLMLQKRAGSKDWVESSFPDAAGADLLSVSLVSNGSDVSGYAVGSRAMILRYAGGRWEREQPTAQMQADGLVDLGGVSAVSSAVAWAVSGSSSTALKVYKREGAWTSVPVDSSPDAPVFGGPHPARGPNGGMNQAAYGAAIAADASGAWVGGAMVPTEVLHPTGDDTPGDESRPFAIRLSAEGIAPITYCPDQYALRGKASNQEVDQTRLCSRPFPASPFGITSIDIAGRDVYAGGLGLFHLRGEDWFREPDATGFLVSVSFASPTEGWMATTGNTFGAGGAVHASEAVIGHWTSRVEAPRAARWPQTQMRPLLGLDVAPDGSGRATAVGVDGAVITYIPEAGWDYTPRPTIDSIHDVGYDGDETMWAVGAQGTILRFDGTAWSEVLEPLRPTRNTLFSLDVDARGRGIAVGGNGTIVNRRGSVWVRDPASRRITDEDLYDVALTPTGAIAVGDGGTIIENRGNGWVRLDAVRTMLDRPEQPAPPLHAVAVLDDGTVLAAGGASALLQRRPAGTFEPFASPVEGTILAMAASRGADGKPRIVASIGSDERKFSGDQMAATKGALIGFDGSRWSDLGLERQRSAYQTTDSSSFLDPVYRVTMDDAASGWAVGGYPANAPDGEGHLRFDATSSVYRVDTLGDATPQFTDANISLPAGLNFGFFGETWCGEGLCSVTMGSGTQADLVAQRIREQINRATALENGPKFVMFGGNGRAVGIPEELAQQAAFLRGFKAPIFAAPGSRDLYGGTDGSIVDSAAGATARPYTRTSDLWQKEFVDFPAPWGSSPAPPGIVPVNCAGCAPPAAGLARTHYSFDYNAGGRSLVRIVVLDSSSKSYGLPVPVDQNPSERQNSWLDSVLSDAKTKNSLAGVPTLVVMNQPTILPDRAPQLNWSNGPSDAVAFQQAMVTNAVSAVVTGGARMAVRDGYPTVETTLVPVYILGTGGAPLGFDPPSPGAPPASKLPSDGFFNSWFLINVQPRTARPGGLPGQVRVNVIPFPVLESIAIHAADGRSAVGGNTLRFSALARGMSGGFSDPEQGRTTYQTLGSDRLIDCEAPGQGNGYCRSPNALQLSYRFWSEDPSIVDFVEPDPGKGNGMPLRRGGIIVREEGGQSGLVCTFKEGSTYINILSGFHRSRMKITVNPGFGPCVDKPIPPRIVPVIPVKPPVVKDVIKRRVPRSRPEIHADFAVIPPPPVPIVAPAPPVAGGYAKKEKHESAREHQGSDFRALQHPVRAEETPGPLMVVGFVTALAMFGAATAGVRSRKHSYAYEDSEERRR